MPVPISRNDRKKRFHEKRRLLQETATSSLKHFVSMLFCIVNTPMNSFIKTFHTLLYIYKLELESKNAK